MKKKDVYTLKVGEKVDHRRYGISTIRDFIPDFGPVITPDSKKGCELLHYDSGADFGTPYLVSDFREIKPVSHEPTSDTRI